MNPTITIRNTQTGELRQVNQTDLPHYGIGDTNQLPSSNPQTLGLIGQYFPQDQIRNAYNIMNLESGGNPLARGDTGIIPGDISQRVGHPIPSYGLYQIRGLPGRPSPQQLQDPRFNIEYAANLYRQQGWAPWLNSARKLGLI